jgi:hypothetical protein
MAHHHHDLRVVLAADPDRRSDRSAALAERWQQYEHGYCSLSDTWREAH